MPIPVDSNAYIKLPPNGAGPVRRLLPALGTGAGPAAAPAPWPCGPGRGIVGHGPGRGTVGRGPGRGTVGRGPGRGLRPRPALRFIVKKHLLIYDVHMYQCIDIHWRFFFL